MLTIYGVYRSRASRIYWLAGELGIPFVSVPVLQARRVDDPEAQEAPLNTLSADYASVSPSTLIPTIDDGGLVVMESHAINLYLAKKHGGPLWAQTDTEEVQMLHWSFWVATNVEPHAVEIVLTHDRDAAGTDEGRAVIRAAGVALRRHFRLLDRHLAATGHVVSDRFTVADLNLAEVFRYTQSEAALFDAVPNVKAWLATCQSRPAFKAMMEARRLEQV